ncbi:MAG: 3-dehydroquinate synthase [Spirochaetaceae bacterium]|jgi:3-dehydroquinate synthase|nr:3-dehydroquinate synthase [Spirochaetaceae bacterium]
MNTRSFTISYPAAGPGNTDIFFHDSIYIPEDSPCTLTVTDEHIADLYKAGLFKIQDEGTLVLPAGEKYKTPEMLGRILEAALDRGLGRDGVFTGFGGGVICDMTAFAASVYMRGAGLELVPTTLLAMVDAAVGGKTACDFGGAKNAVGTFYPASKLHICPAFIDTLPEAEYRSGLAEAVKTAMLYDPELFSLFRREKAAVLARDRAVLGGIIRRCVELKAQVVEEDFTEKGRRMELNLGHTFAHALESAVGLGEITHGEAVAWGIARALDLGMLKGITSPGWAEEAKTLLAEYGWCTLPQHPRMPHPAAGKLPPGSAPQTSLRFMKSDKKQRGGAVRFVLQREAAVTEILPAEDSEVLEVLK